MKTMRKVYYLKCGSMEREFGSKKPSMKEVEDFSECNSPTTNDITLEAKLIEVPTLHVSKPGIQAPYIKRWLS